MVCTYETFKEEVLSKRIMKVRMLFFDSVAGDITSESLECLALYGTLVQFGNSGDKVGTFKTSDVHSSYRNIKGFSLGITRKYHPERLAPIAKK